MKLKKGSAAAKEYMAKIRAKRKKVKKSTIAKPKRAAKKAVKAARKKAAKKVSSMHKDTKSHNVRISVISGVWYSLKPYTLSDLKKLHPDFFRKGYQMFFSVKKMKVVKGSAGHGLFYVEKIQYPMQSAEYTSRKINSDGSFQNTKRFSSFIDLANEVKNNTFKL
jgi:hypothetical protein